MGEKEEKGGREKYPVTILSIWGTWSAILIHTHIILWK
jgi:hypothetical protein